MIASISWPQSALNFFRNYYTIKVLSFLSRVFDPTVSLNVPSVMTVPPNSCNLHSPRHEVFATGQISRVNCYRRICIFSYTSKAYNVPRQKNIILHDVKSFWIVILVPIISFLVSLKIFDFYRSCFSWHDRGSRPDGAETLQSRRLLLQWKQSRAFRNFHLSNHLPRNHTRLIVSHPDGNKRHIFNLSVSVSIWIPSQKPADQFHFPLRNDGLRSSLRDHYRLHLRWRTSSARRLCVIYTIILRKFVVPTRSVW